MTIQERKLQCIEQIILTKDENLIASMESVLKAKRKTRPKTAKKADEKPWVKLIGSISKEDGEEMIRIIEDGCETIDYDSWK